MTARFEETSADLVDLEIRSRLAGRWRMATMNIIFAAIPAAIYLAAGLPATARRHDHRHPGRLHRPAGHPVPPADGPAQRRRRRSPRRWRCSAGSSSTPTCPSRSPNPTDPVASLRATSAVRCGSSTSTSRTTRAADVLTDIDLHRARRRLAGARRRDRQRQVDAGLAGRPAARPDLGPGDHRRRRRARPRRSPTSRGLVGVVTQETYLMHASVRENLLPRPARCHRRRRSRPPAGRPGSTT